MGHWYLIMYSQISATHSKTKYPHMKSTGVRSSNELHIVLKMELIDRYPTDQPPVWHAPWASYKIREIAGAHAPGMPGTFSRYRR